jgi:hypothetical protein
VVSEPPPSSPRVIDDVVRQDRHVQRLCWRLWVLNGAQCDRFCRSFIVPP